MHAKFVIILIVLFTSAKSKDRITYIIKKIKEKQRKKMKEEINKN